MNTTTYTKGQVLTNAADVLKAMETHKVKKTPNGVYKMYFENGKLIGEGSSGSKMEKTRDISYFSQNKFEVIETIVPELKVGDKAVVTEAQQGSTFEKGDVVTIERIREHATFGHTVRNEKGSAELPKWRLRHATGEEVEAYEASIVREGDYAVIVDTKEISRKAEVGDIVKVRLDDGAESVPYRVTNETRGSKDHFWIYRKSVRKATEKEIAEFHVSKLKEGDVAVIVDGSTFINIKEGDLVEITGVRPNQKIAFDIRRADGYDAGAYVTDLRPATETEAQNFKVKKAIKVGYIKLTSKEATRSHHGTPCFEIGEILEASKINSYARSLSAKKLNDRTSQTIRVEDFEIPTTAEIEEAKQPKIKEGDHIVNTGGSTYYDIGEILIVTAVNKGGSHYSVENLEGKQGGKFATNARKATEEEIVEAKKALEEKKERKIFEDLGRYYGQLKKGDIVRVTNPCGGVLRTGDIGEVMRQDITPTDSYSATVDVGGRGKSANSAIVKLVVAVENRKDK
ncbi:hypothetical protein P9Y11_22995 [Bacillus cereus]|nr:hypothetical protein [Bacillus cereus]